LSRRKKKMKKELKGRSHLGYWSAERIHKRGQTTRTIPICQPLFAEINSRDVRWMQLPQCIGARMHFFAPSRVKRDRENFAPPSEATTSYARHPPLDGKMTGKHVTAIYPSPKRVRYAFEINQRDTLCVVRKILYVLCTVKMNDVKISSARLFHWSQLSCL